MSDLVLLIYKLEFWSSVYEFSFQFWGKDYNQVFIEKDDVEMFSAGGEENISSVLRTAVEWCEKVNPKTKYPKFFP